MNLFTTHQLSLIRKIHFFDDIGSTNDIAIELSSDESMHGTLIIAKRQTKARGRKQRQWITDDGDIAMSLLLIKNLPWKGLHLFTLSTALAITKTLGHLGLTSFIKWPNDVVIKHQSDDQFHSYCGPYRKIAGILTETVAKEPSTKKAVIGVGINIRKKHGLFPAIPHAIGVSDLFSDIDRDRFLEIFLPIWDEFLYRVIDEKEHNILMSEYRKQCITINSTVTITEHDEHIQGYAVDVDDDGALMVQGGNGLHKIYGGEILYYPDHGHI